MGKRKSSGKSRSSNLKPNNNELQIRAQHFQGPIPPPEILAKYEEIVPGAAERIIAMAELQGEHRRSLEKVVVNKDIGRATRGQIFAFLIAMTIIIGGFFMIWQGKSLEGMTSIIGAIATLAGVFVFGKVNKNKNLKNRRK